MFPADPLCINNPASTSAPPELFLFNSKSASCISKLVVLTDVVVPDTVRFPSTCTFVNVGESSTASVICALLLVDVVRFVPPAIKSLSLEIFKLISVESSPTTVKKASAVTIVPPGVTPSPIRNCPVVVSCTRYVSSIT